MEASTSGVFSPAEFLPLIARACFEGRSARGEVADLRFEVRRSPDSPFMVSRMWREEEALKDRYVVEDGACDALPASLVRRKLCDAICDRRSDVPAMLATEEEKHVCEWCLSRAYKALCIQSSQGQNAYCLLAGSFFGGSFLGNVVQISAESRIFGSVYREGN